MPCIKIFGMLWASSFLPLRWWEMVVGPGGGGMKPLCVPRCQEELYSLQPSFTRGRLFKIMCWGIFYSLIQFSHFSPLPADGRPGNWLFFFVSLDWLPNGTIGYNPSPVVAREEIKTFLPSSLISRCHWWVSGNNYQTLCSLSHVWQGKKLVSPLMCVCSLVCLYDTNRHSGYEILMTWL